ncbi:hypothetical protein FAZ78_21615, partial [Cereibacter changlensis]
MSALTINPPETFWLESSFLLPPPERHQPLMVKPASASTLAKRVMLYTFKRKTRIDGEVTILTAQQHPDEDHLLA